MAEPDETQSSPFDFSRVPGNDTFRALRSQWEDVLEQPGARTALLQFGISMMQPPSFGDTAFSQAGRAIGAAGEATTAQQVLQQKERESEAKSELAEARAATAGQRATGMEERANIAREKLQLEREKAGALQQHRGLQGELAILRAYNTYREGVNKRNEAKDKDILNPGRPHEVPMSAQEYRRIYGPGLLSGIPADAVEEGTGNRGTPAQPGVGTLTGRGSTGVVEVKTPGELAALPPGTQYSRPGDPPGTIRRKAGPAPTATAEPAARPETEDY